MGASACDGCGPEPGAESALQLAPANSAAAIYVPELGTAVERAEAFVARATANAGAGFVKNLRQGVARRIGLDPLLPSDYAEQGLALDGDALLFAEGSQDSPLLALPVDDAEAVTAFLRQVAENLAGAAKFGQSDGDPSIYYAGRPFGEQLVEVMHWAFVQDYVLVARNGTRELLESALERFAGQNANSTRPQHLGEDATYTRLAGQVGDAPAFVFVRGEAADAKASDPAALSAGAMTAVGFGPKGVATDTFVDFQVPGMAAALDAEPVLPLAERVESGAVLALLTRAARPQALEALRNHPAGERILEQALEPLRRAMDADLQERVLPLLTGALTVAVHVGDLQPILERLGAGELRSLPSLLDTVQVTATAAAAKPEALAELLADNVARLKEQKAPIRTETLDVSGEAVTVYRVETAGSTFAWTLWDDLYVYGAGAGRLEQTLEFLASEPAADSLAPELRGSVGGQLARKRGASVLLLSPEELAQRAQGLQMNGGRLGLQGLVRRLTSILDTLGKLAISLSAEEDGFHVRARQRLQ